MPLPPVSAECVSVFLCLFSEGRSVAVATDSTSTDWCFNTLSICICRFQFQCMSLKVFSQLQQHIQTPNFTILFPSIIWRFLLRVCSYFIHTDIYNNLFLKTLLKCVSFKSCEFVSPLQQYLHTQKSYSFIPLYILKDFTEGFVHISFTLFYFNTLSICFSRFRPFSQNEFFLHFSSTYIHQNLEFYSSLYSEGFYRRVCSYFIHNDLYNISLLKTWRKCVCFLSVDSIFWFMAW